jgi:hypothetical protein
MTLHLLKLAFGCADVAALRAAQAERRTIRGGRPAVLGFTRRMPARRESVLDGGSLYWIVRGSIAVRQPVLDLVAAEEEGGRTFCRLVLDPALVALRPRPHRAIQGWRYLEPRDAPPDAGPGESDLPDALQAELRSLGLL